MRPGGETSNLETAFFPITRATVLRMTGIGGTGKTEAPTEGVTVTGGEAGSMKSFLQQAGAWMKRRGRW